MEELVALLGLDRTEAVEDWGVLVWLALSPLSAGLSEEWNRSNSKTAYGMLEVPPAAMWSKDALEFEKYV